ncbi:MAG: hypothetical protein ABI723_11920 [Bacteroidia bacterium]
MTVSLLDLLSCGLAVVVILLMISLNSGMGNENQLEQAQYIEITFHNREVNQIELQYKDSTSIVNMEQRESFYFADFGRAIDSLAGIRVTEILRPRSILKNRSSKIFQIALPPKASGIELIFTTTLTDNLVGFNDSSAIEYYATNCFDQSPIVADTLFLKNNLGLVSKVNLKFLGNTETWITNEKGDSIFKKFPSLFAE